MDIEFIPKLRGGNDRSSTWDKMMSKIEDSLKVKRKATVEAMSQEDKIANCLFPSFPEIPKTKKGIEKAIDKFINERQPDKDNGKKLIDWFGFYGYEKNPEEEDWTIRIEYLKERIKFKEEENITTITPILSSTNEVVNVVREYLKGFTTEELYDFWIFGDAITEDEAKSYIDDYINNGAEYYLEVLYFYAEEKYNWIIGDKEEDILLRAGESKYKVRMEDFTNLKVKTYPKNIEEYKEEIRKTITEYPNEAKAYCRGIKMIRANYSESAILSTIDKILQYGTTTD